MLLVWLLHSCKPSCLVVLEVQIIMTEVIRVLSGTLCVYELRALGYYGKRIVTQRFMPYRLESYFHAIELSLLSNVLKVTNW